MNMTRFVEIMKGVGIVLGTTLLVFSLLAKFAQPLAEEMIRETVQEKFDQTDRKLEVMEQGIVKKYRDVQKSLDTLETTVQEFGRTVDRFKYEADRQRQQDELILRELRKLNEG